MPFPRKPNPLFEPILFEINPGYSGPNAEDELAEVLSSLISHAEVMVGRVFPIDEPSAYGWERQTVCCRTAFLALSLNAIRASKSILLLIQHKLGEQATQIGRALFETAINAGFMATKDGLAERYLGYLNVLAMRSLLAARANPSKPWAKSMLAQDGVVKLIEDSYKYYCNYFKTDPAKKPATGWIKTDLRARSQKAGLDYDPLYQWFCQYAHVSPQGVSSMLQLGSAGGTIVPGFRVKTSSLLFSAVNDLATMLDLFAQAWNFSADSRLIRQHLPKREHWPRLFYVDEAFFSTNWP